MDEESGTTVALPCLLRGRCYSIQFYIVHAWMCGKVHSSELRNITKIVLLCFPPSLVCVLW